MGSPDCMARYRLHYMRECYERFVGL